ncbi:MAG: hypothetical protein HY290_10235 [Planctomycetia bacterium]|nr:hypothetical protein [Planctomycetia bacterium]
MLATKSSLAIVSVCLLFRGEVIAEPAPAPPDKPANRPIVESTVRLPVPDGNGKLTREVQNGGYRLKLDLSEQIVRLDSPREESWRTPKERIRRGDTVVISDERAPLQAGAATVAQLAKSQIVTISDVRGDWLATSVLVRGQPKSGWLKSSSVKFHAEELPVSATLAQFSGARTVSAALLAQKAKQFDDGLYAAVDVAAQQGAGRFAGKSALLSRLAKVLAEQQPARGDARLIVLAAARLGELQFASSPAVDRAVSATLESFQKDPLRSKPLGFYTWNTTLQRIFRQDRMLQTRLEGEAGIRAIAEALRSDSEAGTSYEEHLKLISRMTNSLRGGDLRSYIAMLDGGSPPSPPESVSFLPPSRSHEADLVMRLYGNQAIPAGFDLMQELIARIRSGGIDLSPNEDSGWYDYQTWALEPLVTPDKTPEAIHLKFEETYRKQLVELFKGVLALTRETHVKQAEFPYPASEAGEREPRPSFYVTPELAVEPLATVYLRRSLAYHFIRGVLEETFGVEALKKMHRLTAAGEVEPNLFDELLDLESLFRGASLTANRQLGLPPNTPAGTGTDPDADAARFLKWSANLGHDADLGQDARMMVPVFFDQQRGKTKVWVVLGWTGRQVCASFAWPPSVQAFNKDGSPLEAGKFDLYFGSDCTHLAYPVMAEVYVTELLDREQFRRHCDTYKTQFAILANLK